MVKALVFGTKDLCVRIAPWSRIILHFLIFFRLRIVRCFFLVPTFDREFGYRKEPAIRVEIVHGCSFMESSYRLHLMSTRR